MRADSYTAGVGIDASRRWANLVGGDWREEAEWLEVRNPADRREVVGVVPRMRADVVTLAYDAAAEAFGAWSKTSAIARGRILLRAAALLRERSQELARILTLEMGKTLTEATGEVHKSADFFEYYGGLGRGKLGYVLDDERPGVSAWVARVPVGVVLAVTPWNDPLLTPARKLAPALIAGDTVVLKPASDTPLIALELARVLADAGLPAGVVNTVTGSTEDLEAALIDHPALAAVSFTGSNAVGAILADRLAERSVPLLAELGGKNAAVVLADADLELAAGTVATAAFAQAGQRCTATSRVIVETSVHDAFVEKLSVVVASLRVGPGLAEGTDVGPLVSDRRRDEVLAFLERGSAGGAVTHVGGRPVDEKLEHGAFVLPTILGEVSPDMEIWIEEVFGPVAAVVSADDAVEAVDLLNGSPYGLAASMFTRDLHAARRFVADAEVGQVAINLPTSGWDVHMPFGGFKASGSGRKEQGAEGLDFYLRTKTVAIAA